LTTIQITKLKTVRLTHGTDTLYLYTELPNGVWPFHGPATLKLEIARGFAEEYCEKNFPGVPHEVIAE
jgi:hypothetical protein